MLPEVTPPRHPALRFCTKLGVHGGGGQMVMLPEAMPPARLVAQTQDKGRGE